MEMSQIASRVAENLQKAPESPARDAVSPPAGEDVEKFRDAMENAAGRVQDASRIGERALGGLANISDQIQAGRMEAMQTLGKKDVTQADLLKAQFSLLESSTLVSAIGKTTEKLAQGVKTLQQG